MGTTTEIAWTDHTFNPWIGCAKVHAGCAHCYAEADFDKRRHVAQWGVDGTRIRTSEAYWKNPVKWNEQARKEGRRHRVFCASLADVFEDRADLVPWRQDLFRLIDATPWLQWQLLTKRPENILQMWPAREIDGRIDLRRRNVWLGTSVSDQQTADQAIPELLASRLLVRILFVSAEPLIGPIEWRDEWNKQCPYCEDAVMCHETGIYECSRCDSTGQSGESAIDWMIIGGESGYGARPCDEEWIVRLIKDCEFNQCRVFVKQLGSNVIDSRFSDETGKVLAVKTTHRKGGDPAEWMDYLRIRQFPVGRELE